MGLEYKAVPFEIKQVVDVSGGGWEIAGYASTFLDSEPDAYGDVIAPGAFAESLASRKSKFLYEHTTPIGRPLELREDGHGLYGRWSIVDTAAGTDAYKLAKAGVLDSLSIGYLTQDSEIRDDGARLLKKVDLFEVSCVAIPANTNAVITDIKTGAKAVWSGSYINGLPDNSFALILPGGTKDETGKTTPRDLRKLPHHDGAGNLDAAHVRGALSRAPQLTGVSDGQRQRAVSHLQKHLAALGKSRRLLRHKDCNWDDDDEGITAFAAGSYEDLAEDLEEAFEAVAIPSGQMGYAEVVATFADRFVAVVHLLDADGTENPIVAEDPVYWQVPYTVDASGAITLGQQTEVEPEVTFGPPDTGKRLNLSLELRRRKLAHHGILVGATS